MELLGSKAMVTGCTHGIGRAVALRLAEEGADLILVDVDEDGLARLAVEIRGVGRQALDVTADVTRSEEVTAAVERAITEYGRVDILVNNVGGSRGAREIEATSEEDFDHVIRMNLKSTFLCTRAIIPHMKRQGGGRIINVASVAAKVGGITGSPSYSAAKAGVLGLTRHAAAELAPFKIVVNAVAPGVTLSERIARRLATWTEEERQDLVGRIPLGRFAEVDEVAACVVFLCSKGAGYVTGATLDVNGGLFMG